MIENDCLYIESDELTLIRNIFGVSGITTMIGLDINFILVYKDIDSFSFANRYGNVLYNKTYFSTYNESNYNIPKYKKIIDYYKYKCYQKN